MTNITTKELEERSKRIFNVLGLKDLDIKISRNENGKKSTEHVHVDKDGAKVSTSEDPNYSESTKKNIEEENKVADRFAKAVKNLSDWVTGSKTYDQMFASLKDMFEERCKEKFGNLDVDNLIKEIDNNAAKFFDDPIFGPITKSLRDVGVNISQEDINTAAEQLKKQWIPSYTCKSGNEDCKNKAEDTCKKTCQEQEKKEETKASILRASILKEKEREAADKKLRQDIIDKIQNAIISKTFTTFDSPISGEKNIGIEVVVTQNHTGAFSYFKSIYESAGEFIRDDYGFSASKVLMPESNNDWRFKFWF